MIDKPQVLPKPSQRVIEADGTMNKFWRQYLEDIDRKLRELIDASNDHETRITALEP